MRPTLALGLSLLLGTAAGCVHVPELAPAEPAGRVRGEEGVAFAEEHGVRVEVDGGAWDASPGDLGLVVTPVRVRVVNRSGRPLRVGYRDFSLEGRSGFVYAAVPPLRLQGYSSAQPPGVAPAQAGIQVRYTHRYHSHSGFWVAPYWGAYFGPTWPWWGGPFAADPWYYQRYYGYWPSALPTRDVIELALPEGVLQDGGEVTGFLYFQNAGRREDRVVFRADLVHAESGQRFGAVRVPLVVR